MQSLIGNPQGSEDLEYNIQVCADRIEDYTQLIDNLEKEIEVLQNTLRVTFNKVKRQKCQAKIDVKEATAELYQILIYRFNALANYYDELLTKLLLY